MTAYIHVKIDTDTALQMLSDRLDVWPATAYDQSPDEKALFMDMYSNMIDCGCFDGGEFDPVVIVDNDVVNNCRVVRASDNLDDWKKLVAVYKNGDCDISCETFEELGHADYIEAMNEDAGLCLVR